MPLETTIPTTAIVQLFYNKACKILIRPGAYLYDTTLFLYTRVCVCVCLLYCQRDKAQKKTTTMMMMTMNVCLFICVCVCAREHMHKRKLEQKVNKHFCNKNDSCKYFNRYTKQKQQRQHKQQQ